MFPLMVQVAVLPTYVPPSVLQTCGLNLGVLDAETVFGATSNVVEDMNKRATKSRENPNLLLNVLHSDNMQNFGISIPMDFVYGHSLLRMAQMIS